MRNPSSGWLLNWKDDQEAELSEYALDAWTRTTDGVEADG